MLQITVKALLDLVLMMVTVKFTIFYDATPCNLVYTYQRFGGICSREKLRAIGKGGPLFPLYQYH
jgi:hypothetical protein